MLVLAECRMLPVSLHWHSLPPPLICLQGTTQAPPRLTERDLISKMEEFGIGTDATVADHIQKQVCSAVQCSAVQCSAVQRLV